MGMLGWEWRNQPCAGLHMLPCAGQHMLPCAGQQKQQNGSSHRPLCFCSYTNINYKSLFPTFSLPSVWLWLKTGLEDAIPSSWSMVWASPSQFKPGPPRASTGWGSRACSTGCQTCQRRQRLPVCLNPRPHSQAGTWTPIMFPLGPLGCSEDAWQSALWHQDTLSLSLCMQTQVLEPQNSVPSACCKWGHLLTPPSAGSGNGDQQPWPLP